jgi:hypothetical protein
LRSDLRPGGWRAGSRRRGAAWRNGDLGGQNPAREQVLSPERQAIWESARQWPQETCEHLPLQMYTGSNKKSDPESHEVMATTTIEARCNARPTRLAFILPNPDLDLLIRVIARGTALWGGIFNPIVILNDSTRKTSGVHYTMPPPDPYIQIQAEMLRAFDPDLLISYSNDPLPEELKPWQHRTFPADHLDWRPRNDEVMSYFVDVFPILDELWDKEFKGIANPRLKIKFVDKAESEKSLFLAARFGLYSGDDYYEFLRKTFNAETLIYDAAFRSSRWPGDFLTLLDLTASYCRPTPQRVHSHAYFLLNPADPFDVVDFWNLRASGTHLFPLTLKDYQECAKAIGDFGAAAAYPINESITNHPVIIKAPSITDEEQTAVATWIGSMVKELSMMGWVPHYRTGHYGVVSELDISPIRGFESNATGVLVEGHGKIEGPKPIFLTRENVYEHWSMDISFFTFLSPNTCYKLPWLNAGCDALASRKIGHSMGINATRVSKEGIVTRHDGDSGDVRIAPITAIDAVRAFLEGKEIEYMRTSSPGLALTRVIEMLDGFYKCEVFRNPAIREVLEELATGKHRLANEVRGAVKRSLKGYKIYSQPASSEQISERAESLITRAIEATVFRVGLEFQCSRCKRYHWYAVTEFNDGYNCKSCFSRELTPRLDTTKWYYASDGLFRSANKLDGNLTILLALAFFNEVLDHDLKYAPSFDYKINGEQHEVDFGIIGSRMLRPHVEMIFGESKSGTALKSEEREKLKTLGQKTESYLCFCTLADDFSHTDKEFFRDLYDAGIKVIMLTRFFLEMESFEVLEFRTKNNPGRSDTMPDWLMRLTILRTLGDAFARKHNIWL